MQRLEQLLNRIIEFSLLTPEEEQTIKEELLDIEQHYMPKTPYINFITEFNSITGKKYKPDIESRKLYYENAMLYSFSDRIKALKNAVSSSFVKTSNSILSPKWILRPDITAQFMNYVEKEQKDNTDNKNLDGNNYTEVTV